ncbi:MAG TPA: RIP metalloprotease RseP [Acetobacteraceae bacterium]|jgi:regulator of sigma E protease|nr:RIP metalloprotease RseP [Acetobacteraceae bacterium]
MPAALQSTLAFLVVLGVLVFVHELGHYLAARLVRVHVEVFSIGFGPAIVSWRDRVGTAWKLGWLPLGGYVKLHGHERPEVISEGRGQPAGGGAGFISDQGSQLPVGESGRWIPGRVFHEKSVAARALVVAAGPIANFVLAMVLFGLLYATVGRPVNQPVAGDVLAGSAAARAGIQADDRIVAIDGSPTSSFEEIQRIVAAHPAETLSVKILRGQNTIELPVLTDARESGGRKVGMLGIRNGGPIAYERLSLPDALVGGVTETWRVTSETVVGVAQMITGRRGTEDLGGPLRIAQLSGQVAQLGIASLVSFIALLSVNLGLINLFPIPVLDGGHLLFYLAEAIRGRPVPARAQEYGFRAGLALIAGLFILATWNDLAHFGMFH